jgi:hypothetical protein
MLQSIPVRVLLHTVKMLVEIPEWGAGQLLF